MAAQVWNLDTTHSHIGFTVRHLVITKVHGSFAKFSGKLTYDAAAPESAKVEATIDVNSIDTAEEKRDAH
jgi:polyisoprenoid-binding protein YceI